MSKSILLVEPYAEVAAFMVELLDLLDYEADLVTTGCLSPQDLKKKDYLCVLINLDQNRDDWRTDGLQIAQMASRLDLPVVMIPDHETASKAIADNGWLQFGKPFTIAALQSVISKAAAGKSNGSADR